MWRMNAVLHVNEVPAYKRKIAISMYRNITNFINSQFLLTEEHGDTPAALTSQLMQNPQILADLQHRLGSMVGVSSGYIQRYVGSTAVQ